MHEIDLALEIVALVEEERERRGDAQVARIEVRVGALSCVAAEALAPAFEEARRGSGVEGATLDLVRVDAVGQCREHGEVPIALGRGLACPSCREPVAEVLSGEELTLEAITFAEPVGGAP